MDNSHSLFLSAQPSIHHEEGKLRTCDATSEGVNGGRRGKFCFIRRIGGRVSSTLFREDTPHMKYETSRRRDGAERIEDYGRACSDYRLSDS